jgi:ribosomal protein L29
MARKDAKEAEILKNDVAKTAKAVTETAKDLRALTEQQLQAALQTAKDDLQMAKKMLKSNELPASHVIKKTKKKIAQIYTVLTEKNNERSENE